MSTDPAHDPYQAPRSDVFGVRTASGRVWRSGKLLCLEKGATLPPRCVRCNRPAETSLERKLYWHSPWWALTILIGLLAYAIIALVVRKRADVGVHLCSEHARARRQTLAIAWIVGLGAVPAMFLLPQEWFGVGVLLATFAVLGSLVAGSRAASVLRPKRIDDREARLDGAGGAFLDSLERQAA